jgi:parallel beta-helix repeat protein
MKNLHITVGQQDADIIGGDNLALQAAVDYVAALGGGTVEIQSGTYTMRDSLHLRNNITVKGQGEDTTLWKADGFESPLVLDGDFGEEQITVKHPEEFKVGYGVSITDDHSGGFHTAVGTILWRDGDTFGINIPMGGDYLVSHNARAATTFPVISGYHLENAHIENLTIDGNKKNNPHLNGCRGAGIFLYRGHHTTITNCTVRNYHGDGISFQQSQHVQVEHCTCVGNTHLGLHPGSGSQHPTIRLCHSENNGRIGLYLCWRVKHGVFENNDLIQASLLDTKTQTTYSPTTVLSEMAVKAFSSATSPSRWADIAIPLKTMKYLTMAEKIQDTVSASSAKPTTLPSPTIASATTKLPTNVLAFILAKKLTTFT